jgi:hypothetical protein
VPPLQDRFEYIPHGRIPPLSKNCLCLPRSLYDIRVGQPPLEDHVDCGSKSLRLYITTH